MKPWRLTIPRDCMRLQRHLFPAISDEHGAVIKQESVSPTRPSGWSRDELLFQGRRGLRCQLKRGFRMFIQSKILRARDQLAYLAIHNHGGTDSVGFSGPDMASHERGYPALLDIARGMPVGALVLSRSAVAGDLWFPGCDRASREPDRCCRAPTTTIVSDAGNEGCLDRNIRPAEPTVRRYRAGAIA